MFELLLFYMMFLTCVCYSKLFWVLFVNYADIIDVISLCKLSSLKYLV